MKSICKYYEQIEINITKKACQASIALKFAWPVYENQAVNYRHNYR